MAEEFRPELNYVPLEEPSSWDDVSGLNKAEDKATRSQIFAQNAAPTKDFKEGDLWFDTDDNNTVYRANSSLQWVSVQDGTIATKGTVFRQDGVPTALAAGDIWFDSNDSDKQYVATAAGDDEVKAGEWERVDVGQNPTLIDALQTTNAPAEAGADVTSDNETFSTESDINCLNTTNGPAEANADVTGSNTALNTTNISNTPSTSAEFRFNKDFFTKEFIGNYNDGLTESGATVVRYHVDTVIETNAGTATASLYSDTSAELQYLGDWDQDYTMTWVAKLTASTAQDAFMGLYDRSAITPDITGGITDRHIGFIIHDGTIYATVADGTTQSTSEIAAYDETAENAYMIRWDNGTDAKFYMKTAAATDYTLVATLSSNIPSANASDEPCIFFGMSRDADTKIMILNNNYHLINRIL